MGNEQVVNPWHYLEENRSMSLTMRAMKAVMFRVSRSKHDFEQSGKL